MNELTLRPRSATELVDAAFQVFRRNPMPFVLGSAIIYIPWMIVRLIIDPTKSGTVPSMASAPVVFVSTAISMVVYAIAGAVTMRLAREAYLDRTPDLADAFRSLSRVVVPLIVATILMSLILLLGLVLFIIPFFILLARFFAVRPAIVLEQAGINESFARSAKLSSDSKGHILATLMLAGLIVILVSMGLGVIVSMMPNQVVAFIVAVILALTLYPFLAIVEVLLYFDMRIRKEGFDIEYLSTAGQPMGVGGPAV